MLVCYILYVNQLQVHWYRCIMNKKHISIHIKTTEPDFSSRRHSTNVTNVGNQIFPVFQFLVKQLPECLNMMIEPSFTNFRSMSPSLLFTTADVMQRDERSSKANILTQTLSNCNTAKAKYNSRRWKCFPRMLLQTAVIYDSCIFRIKTEFCFLQHSTYSSQPSDPCQLEASA